MSEFVRSPLWDNWFKKGKAKKTFLLCSPYLKKGAIDRIAKEFGLSNDNCNLELRILIRGRLNDFIDGSSDLTALDALINMKCIDVHNVRRLTNLHMKAYLKDENDLLMGSGNCTNSGLFVKNGAGNAEGAIRTCDKTEIIDFLAYFDELFDSAESLNTFYDTISNEYNEYAANSTNAITPNQIKGKDEEKAKYKFGTKSHSDPQKQKYASTLAVEDIPQFSKLEYVLKDTLERLKEAEERGEKLTFAQLGALLPNQRSEKIEAKRKFGENHSKAAEILQFASIIPERTRKIIITPLGNKYLAATQWEKDNILAKQLLQSNIIREIINKYNFEGYFDLKEYLGEYIKESTIKRRFTNIRTFFQILEEYGVEEAKVVRDGLFSSKG